MEIIPSCGKMYGRRSNASNKTDRVNSERNREQTKIGIDRDAENGASWDRKHDKKSAVQHKDNEQESRSMPANYGSIGLEHWHI